MPWYAAYGVCRVYCGANGTRIKNNIVNYWLPWHDVMSRKFHFDGNLFCLCANIIQSHGNANHFSFSRETKNIIQWLIVYTNEEKKNIIFVMLRVPHQLTANSKTYPHIYWSEKNFIHKKSTCFYLFHFDQTN